MRWDNRLKGFTLIEVLVAVFIISISISGLLAILLMGKKTIKSSKYRIKALNYAQETLEELRNYVTVTGDYAHLPNGGNLDGDTYSWALADNPSGTPHSHTIQNSTDVALGFSRTYDVDDLANGLKEVTITVNYPEVSP